MVKAALRSVLHKLGRDPVRRLSRTPAFRAQQALVGADTARAVFDVGACVGDTVAVYRRLLPRAPIFAFEPFPESLAKLGQRFAGDPKVSLIGAAAAEAPGTHEFFVSEHRGANSLLPRPEGERRYYGKGAEHTGRIEVPVTTLDDVRAERGIERIALLKMDIQGGELRALRGARKALAEQAIDAIYVEVEFVPFYEGGALFFEICALLAEHDYGLYDLYHLFHAKNGQLRYGDAIFVSRETRTRVLDAHEAEP